ncbi:MAG TPA: hypothetical protein VK957_05675 [Lunatimonas sp.]|nr:hypothetical protein [Lunatimonas sp.]
MNKEQVIPKEAVSVMHFLKEDVLKDPSDIRQRNQDLNRAMTLGNLEHGKVKIHFLDAQHNFYQVETTVWAVTDDYLCLKGDLQIPTCAVLRID